MKNENVNNPGIISGNIQLTILQNFNCITNNASILRWFF